MILVVGSRLGNLDVPYDKYWGDAARCSIIHVDVEPRHIGVSRPVALGIVADAKATLEGLCTKLSGRTLASKGRTDLAKARNDYRAFGESMLAQIAGWKGDGIHPAQACGVIGAVFGPRRRLRHRWRHDVAVGGARVASTRPSSYHGILEFGMLGTGIPSALGAKLGDASREVVCVSGDGAAGFNVMELETAAREGVKITIVVLAEGQWTMEIPNPTARWGKTFGTGMGLVHWDKIAQGLGCHGEYVDSIEALPAALALAKAYAGPALLCVRTNKEANLAVPESGIARFFEVYFGPSA